MESKRKKQDSYETLNMIQYFQEENEKDVGPKESYSDINGLKKASYNLMK